MNDKKTVDDLYVKKDTLSTRINIHEKYSVNKYGWNNWIFDQYIIKENYKIIEFGCGNGNFWKNKLDKLPYGVKITLSDFSPLMVEKVKENLFKTENIDIQLIDIQNVPFSDKSFDIVIANHMLYHVPDFDKALTEVRRILKSEGAFYTTTIGKNNLNQLEIIYRIFENICRFNYSGNLSFILENGKEKLEKHFQNIVQRKYSDHLEVTEVDDLMDYIVSYNSIPEEIYQEIYKNIVKEIERYGVMKISKDSGMFICT